MRNTQNANDLSGAAVVGAVHSAASLAVARETTKSACDFLELRLDNFAPSWRKLRDAAPGLPLPLIVTARHPAEGGANALALGQRRELYREFLGVATLVDIELRSARALAPVIAEAKAAGVRVILSYHNFERTPPEGKLRELSRRARSAGADVFKVATRTDSASAVAVLIDFLSAEKAKGPMAVMGMGGFGKVSRLILAQAGSCLNYGCLGEPNASGQWPVGVLKGKIAELGE